MTEPTQDREPVIPHPDVIAAEIQSVLVDLEETKVACKSAVNRLRRQLKLSCECHGVQVHDPSARAKKAVKP